MPLMGGIELLEEMRKDNKVHDTIVFVLTTSPREKDKLKAYQLNAAGYFLKENLREVAALVADYSRINNFEGTF
jgi:CheY-like chemotaxis protein